MSVAAAAGRDFVALSRRFLDVLGADGLGDESDQRQFAVDGIEPSWVLLPATASEAATALGICAEHDLAVVPVGRGLRLGRGRVPRRLDVVLSTSAMGAIVDHAAADLTVTVEAGATLAAVNDALRSAGQWLPFDPPLPHETTIGGLIAAQAAGPRRQAFGTVRDSLLGIHALLADGTAVKSGGRVVKNVAGYDLHKLLVGSFGTLALIVEATFKLQPLPETKRLVSFGPGAATRMIALALTLADANLGTQMLELLVGPQGETVLVVEFAGMAEDVEEAERRAASRAGDFVAEPFDETALRARLDAFERAAPDSVVLRAAVPRAFLGAWLVAALERCAPTASRVSAHAHAALGITRLRLEAADDQRFPPLLERLRAAAREGGGYLIVEHAPLRWKRWLDVWGPPSAGHDLMKGIKAAFDPRGLLAPGRFVGGL